MVVAGAVAAGGVIAFLMAHLLMLALAAIALPVATLAAVRYLRRYMVLVHKEPPRPIRRAQARPALAPGRPALAQARPALVRARPALARPRPALEAPEAAQLTMGGYHLHFHGVSAAEVAALLRRGGEPAALRRDGVPALPAADERARA